MAPFEALYGQRCHTPLKVSQTGERKFFGPALVEDAEEKVRIIKENLRIAQERQKSHYDKGKAPREYKVSDFVYLKVLPTKGVQ
jgi:hypothetical protein